MMARSVSLVITYCLMALRDFEINFLSHPISIWSPHNFICSTKYRKAFASASTRRGGASPNPQGCEQQYEKKHN
jgi:hypothetical protein